MRLKLARDIHWEDLECIESPSFAKSEVSGAFFTTGGFQHVRDIDEALLHIGRTFNTPRRTKWMLEELLENIEQGKIFLVNESRRTFSPALEWEADEEAEDGGKWQFIVVTMGFFEHNLKWLVEGISRPNVSFVLDATPVVGVVKGAIQTAAGKDIITGEKVHRGEEAAATVAAVVPFGKVGTKTVINKMGGKGDDEISVKDVNSNKKISGDTESELNNGRIGGRNIPGHTKPTGVKGGKPVGYPAKIKPKMTDENKRSIKRENESANILADAGYKVEQNPKVPGNKDPDLLIEDKVFDVKSPSGSRARNAASEIEEAVNEGQANRIVLNLEDSDITLDTMKNQLDTWPIEGLKEIIVIKDGSILPFWP